MSDTVRRLFLYLLTAGAAAVVDIGAFALLSATRMSVIPSAGCSFCTAMGMNFLLTTRFAFRARASRRNFALFVMGAAVGLLVNVTLTSAAVIGWNKPRIIAKTIAIGATFLLNFWINARFVFRDASDHSSLTSQGVD